MIQSNLLERKAFTRFFVKTPFPGPSLGGFHGQNQWTRPTQPRSGGYCSMMARSNWAARSWYSVISSLWEPTDSASFEVSMAFSGS